MGERRARTAGIIERGQGGGLDFSEYLSDGDGAAAVTDHRTIPSLTSQVDQISWD